MNRFISWVNKHIVFWLPYIIVFTASIYNPNDADLGWYLKYGEYFFRYHQILRTNIFSAMMHDYQWVNHSWATDILSYAVFSNFGFLGLNILGALVITLIFYSFAKAAELTPWQQIFIFPLILYIESPLNAVSFRAQLLSYFLLGILFYILNLYEKRKNKIIFWTVPLFLIWANFHGEFILGIAIMSLWFFIRLMMDVIAVGRNNYLKVIPELKLFTAIILLSFMVTLLNPFGLGVYTETLRHFFNPWSRYIAEWLPFEPLSQVWWNHITMGILILLGFITLFFTGKLKYKLPYLGIVAVLFVLSFIMRRYAWPLYYMTLTLIAPLADLFKPPNKKWQFYASFSTLLIIYAVVILIKSPFSNYSAMSWDRYCLYRSCSPQAAEFIINNHLTGDKLLTMYDWGGWLIWNYPQVKPTIDGRMVFWKDHGYSAFGEYYPLEQNWKDVAESKYDTVFASPSKPLYGRLTQLVNQGKWKIVYQDKFAGVFVRL